MSEMFCFQCEQTAGGKGCTKVGVCGKKPDVAGKHDELISALIDLARAVGKKGRTSTADDLMMQGLFMTVTNVNFDPARDIALILEIKAETETLGGGEEHQPGALFEGDPDVVSLRSTLLFGMLGMASYAWHAHVLGQDSDQVTDWLFKGMRAIAEDHTVDEWLGLIMEFGQVNLACMGLLDKANTESFGHPVPTKVPMMVEKGPFIVVTGHDLLDLKQLLEQTDGKGINIYTHGEMLPAHGYPELKKYAHLKGNFGTAWQNQQKEFDAIPPISPISRSLNRYLPQASVNTMVSFGVCLTKSVK